MKNLRVLMASWEEVIEPLFRKVIEGGGHHLTISQPWKRKDEFIEEARSGGFDVVIVTNFGLPLDYSLSLIAPLREACIAKVIVMSGAADPVDRETASREGACAFYKMPMPVDKLLGAVEAAAEGAVIVV